MFISSDFYNVFLAKFLSLISIYFLKKIKNVNEVV